MVPTTSYEAKWQRLCQDDCQNQHQQVRDRSSPHINQSTSQKEHTEQEVKCFHPSDIRPMLMASRSPMCDTHIMEKMNQRFDKAVSLLCSPQQTNQCLERKKMADDLLKEYHHMLHPSTSIEILSDSKEATQKVLVYCRKGEMKKEQQFELEHAACCRGKGAQQQRTDDNSGQEQE